MGYFRYKRICVFYTYHQARPNPGIQDEGQAGPNPGNDTVSQTLSTPCVHAGPNLKYTDADTTDATRDTEAESMVSVTIHQDNSAIPPMTSQPQQVFSDSILINRLGELEQHIADLVDANQALEERLDKHGSRLYKLENQDIPNQVRKVVDEIVTDAVDWAMQAPLRERFRDLPEADMKEILHNRMWESKSYQTHEDHMMLYEALEKSMARDNHDQLLSDLAEANKMKKKRYGSPKTPSGSPPHPPPPPAGPSRTSGASGTSGSSQPPPPPPPPSNNQGGQSTSTAAPSSSQTATSAEYTAWTTTGTRIKPYVSPIPEELHMDDDTTTDEQAYSSGGEDVGCDHIPTINLRQSWWKPITEDRPAIPEPAWSIPLSDLTIGDMATFIDWYCKKQGIAELTQKDLEGPAYEIVKVFHPDVVHLQFQMEECHKLLTDQVDDAILRPALSISKMKAAYYPDVGLEKMVPDQIWIEEECKYDVAAMYGISDWWFQRQRFYIDRHTSEGDRKAVRTHMRILSVVKIKVFSMNLVIRQRVEDFQLGIESYQTQLNLTKSRWDAKGFKYKHDFIVIDSPRAVTFKDKYGVQMIMRFNEIHKFSDGTLQQIDEALDYKVKEFRVNGMNPGLDTRFYTKKDVDRSKEFMFSI
ncbi:hypothetical protein Tco_1423940 [Tanacetum coccineum]